VEFFCHTGKFHFIGLWRNMLLKLPYGKIGKVRLDLSATEADKKQPLICQTLLSSEMEAVQEKVLFFNVNISYILYI
jgi:hypothetical protein